jgi:TolB-like protein/Flp pilus assembly protein TadD
VTDPGKAVFLSYASQDAEAAQQLCSALRAADIEVWFDQSELRGGDAWDALIRKQIKGCYLFVPIISANTQSREEGYFRREWNLAVARTLDMAEGRAFLLPIVIDGTSDSEARVPEKFREVQWTRLPEGASLEAFLAHVRRLTAPEANAPKTPSPPIPPSLKPTPATRASPSAVSTRPGVRSLLPWVVSTVLILGVGYIVADKFLASKRTAPTTEAAITVPAKAERVSNKSIAVLPFVDMSEKKDQEYFSDGLSEELIDHLAHSVDLMVIARTSSFQFKGKNEDVRTIAAKLGVANLLEGSVRTSGHAVRITAQLIRASDGTHLWSQTYDRQMSDIFKVQDEIAGTVVEALNATLSGGTPDSAGKERNIEAYNLLLKGNYFYARSHPGDSDQAIERYKQALKLDPNYALAWAKLARVYIVQGQGTKFSRSEIESMARDALQRSLSIDPNLAVAHRWLGRIYLNFRWDWTAAKSEFEQAMALDPNGPEGGLAHADLLIMTAAMTGRFEDSIRFASEDVVRSPLDTSGLFTLGWILFDAGQLEEATAIQHRLLELDPAYQSAHADAAETSLLMGKNADALDEALKETEEVNRLPILALVYWAMGRRTDADVALRQLETKFADGSAYDIGAVHAYRGEAEAAVTWLERAYRQRDGAMVFLKVDPLLHNLHSDPRFKTLLRKMNLPE